MSTVHKHWAALGAGALLAGGVLAGCGQAAPSDPAGEERAEVPTDTGETRLDGLMADAGEAGEGYGGEGGESGEAGAADAADLAIEKRVAFMSGHVAAGLALYRAGAPEQAAPHLLHPVSEAYVDEREGLDALGFDSEPFEEVSRALEEGRPASEVEPMLAEAERNMAQVRAQAGGDPVEVIAYLMDMVATEYTVGVTDGEITDPGEYQDAYGFAVVALDMARGIGTEASTETVSALEALVAMWPGEAPLKDQTPPAVSEVVAQASEVTLGLSDL